MKKLNEKQINLIHEHQGAGPREFKTSSVLYYEGQVPVACYLLLEGRITLMRKKKHLMDISPGHIIGLSEFQRKIPSDATAWISAGSKAFIIDRSTFIELDAHQDGEVKRIVS